MATLSVIRRWALREHLSLREIARRTGLSRNTIKKYLRVGAEVILTHCAEVKVTHLGEDDMFYIQHNSDNFTIIDCNLIAETAGERIEELKLKSQHKGITRFISTHPDQDHFGGIELLDDKMPIANFYVVKNKATKSEETESFKHYCKLRDEAAKAF